MLKKITLRKLVISSLLLLLALILFNYPEEIVEEKQSNDKNFSIFLLDNDLVVMDKIYLDESSFDNLIYSINNELTIGSSTSRFNALIPKNTKLINYSFNDGVLKLNYSKEMLNIKPKYEEKMIESIIYSFTSIKDVKKVMIFVDGVILNELPNSKIKLPTALDRSYGINKIYDISSLNNIDKCTIYYLNSKNNDLYYVPVSFYVNDDDKINIIIKNLKSNIYNNGSFFSYLNKDANLIDYVIEDDNVKLIFDNDFIDDSFDGKLNEEVKYAFLMSVLDSFNVSKAEFFINNSKISD